VQLYQLQHHQVLVLHVPQIFVVIVVYVSKLDMEQAYNVIVQQAGLVHDVNIVSCIFNVLHENKMN
jgi:hypothetical protein